VYDIAVQNCATSVVQQIHFDTTDSSAAGCSPESDTDVTQTVTPVSLLYTYSGLCFGFLVTMMIIITQQ